MKQTLSFWVRKLHRYLGLVLGIQFLFWTAGGLYFSWSNMDEIHGDHQKHPAPLLRTDWPLVSPQVVLEAVRQQHPLAAVVSLQLIDVLGAPVYQVVYQEKAGVSERQRTQLADALTGRLRNPLSQPEAVALAQSRFQGDAPVKQVKYLTSVNAHHEYRENPLPAYAVQFDHPSQTTVYVAAELGTVQKFRNGKWRTFDFLWMLHTMDYQSRDHFGNWLLRAFSIFGLLTILSGFVLYYVSSPLVRKAKRRLRNRSTVIPAIMDKKE